MWLRVDTTREAITKDLEEMKAKGIEGEIIYDSGVGKEFNIKTNKYQAYYRWLNVDIKYTVIFQVVNRFSDYLTFRFYICIMKKVGILGGGQLGRMLLQAAANYSVETYLMENDDSAPASHLCHHFTKGDVTNYENVYQFGKDLDAITIEIEHVNLEALEKLEAAGVKIIPNCAALKIIKNKIIQKQYYESYQIPTSPFIITSGIEDIYTNLSFLPAVQKIGEGGYDGRGVHIIAAESDIQNGFNVPAVLEKMVDIKQEIAIMIAIGNDGQTAIYPPVDMVFDKSLHLLSHQISPATLPESVFWKVEAIAIQAVKHLNSPGIFAVEMFIDHKENVWVNEMAPRVHNSGHHSIEANYCSQFDMLWRILLGFPLGNTQPIMNSALLNLIGNEGFHGEPYYAGMNEVLAIDNVYVHTYGKKQTKPGRKMGHVTILSHDKKDLQYKINQIKQLIFVESQ